MTRSGLLLAASVALMVICAPQLASADSIPGLRGHDHTGLTVPDVKAATAFFTDVIGCTHAMSFGPFSDDNGTFMQDVVNVNPRAVIEPLDYTDSKRVAAAWERVRSRWDGIDLVLIVAGTHAEIRAWELTEVNAMALLNTNLHGVIKTCAVVLPALLAQRYGAIGIVGSVNRKCTG